MKDNELTKLIELINQLPDGLQSDWRDTNHYELTTPQNKDEYFWLCFSDMGKLWWSETMPCDTEEGHRLGLVMDIAAQASKCKDAIKELRDDVIEYAQEAFLEGASMETKGKYKGWYCTNARTSLVNLGERLFEIAGWEKHPDSSYKISGHNEAVMYSRVAWYRPAAAYPPTPSTLSSPKADIEGDDAAINTN